MTPEELGRLLRSTGLAATLATAVSAGSGTGAVAAIRARADGDLAVLLDLFCLQQAVPAARVARILGASAVDLLAERGLLSRADDRVTLDGVRLVNHFGALVLVGAPGAFRNGYYGNDSVGLGRLLLGARGRALDLFASTGAQAMLLARSGDPVTTVEIDASLAPILEFNARLNRCAERIRPNWGDARTVPLDGPYDVVSANAPLVPSFGVPGLASGADGGPDGHTLLAQALRRVELTDGGQLFFTATVPGGPAGPDLRWLDELARQRGWRVTLTATATRPLAGAVGDSLIGTLAQASGEDAAGLAARLREQWARDGIDAVHFCLAVATGTRHATGVTVTYGIDKGRGWWI